ncbi:MAG: type II toxin-antitoxin system prevent-host-death family antitoxin [Candidatus Electrothrix aestuarii]|jgi:prevent-host-death family protein|uniref:Antitoxin n=1 Tax=Candidatus Electrothrix aestuarii TaxID=3062594 RepID=A0AAU8LQB8_9BACT|nr:type II toxin-antitoxin system prevent-host-death family antitoxin [Candidatus Electrothrix aestuarii]WPD24373.1 MAG: type II toxin-antitoxin system prevent-host-death family antitoxin [Candidatus Electrothrix sp. GW3-3]
MQATSKDLRFHTKKILDAARRGEEVVITFHGKPYAKIVPLDEHRTKDKQNEFCGMWKDREDMKDVEGYVRQLRKGRSF